MEGDGPAFKSAFSACQVTLYKLLNLCCPKCLPVEWRQTGPLLSSAAPLVPQLGLSETLIRNLSLCQRKRKRKDEMHK